MWNKMGAAAAILSVTALSGATYAADPTNAELLDRIKVLEEKLEQVQAKQQQPTSAEIDAAVNRVLKDAEQRSRIFSGDSFVGGWNADKQQFFLGSRDGSFYLHPGIVLQFRNSTSFRQDGKKSGENDLQNGFEVRRAKFGFDGNIFGPDLTYKFQWQSSTNGGNPTVEYAWVQYLLAHKIAGGPNDFAIRAGQFKNVV